MKLNHINLVVSDVAATTQLFEIYFGFSVAEIKGDNVIAILRGQDDFTLVIMSDRETPTYPKAFHIGFMQDSEQQVTEIYQRLKDGGIDVGTEPRSIRGGFGFYFTFDSVMIEIGIQ